MLNASHAPLHPGTHGRIDGCVETEAALRGLGSGDAPAAPGKPPEALDPHVLAALRRLDGDEPGFLAELAGDFLAGARLRLDAMRRALAERRAAEAAREAHGLRGIAGTIGARRLAELATGVERAEGAVVPIDELETELRRVRRALAAALVG